MSEAVVDLVWYLPGVAERFGMYVQLVRRLLFISADLIKLDQKDHGGELSSKIPVGCVPSLSQDLM